MTTVIAIGATLCVPIIIVLTLEVEARADRWLQCVARWFGRQQGVIR